MRSVRKITNGPASTKGCAESGYQDYNPDRGQGSGADRLPPGHRAGVLPVSPYANQNKDGEVCEIDATVKHQLLANRDAFFDKVWDAALIMCDAIRTDGG